MIQIRTSYAHLERLDNKSYKKNKEYINQFRSENFPADETFLHECSRDYLNFQTKYVIYLVKSNKDNDILAYFTLCSGAIFWEPEGNIKSNPTIEISYFVVNDKYRIKNGKGSGVGKMIFEDFILPTIKQINEEIGFIYIMLFAIPTKKDKVINAYKSMGFTLSSRDTEEYIQDRNVRNCRLMYRNI